MSEKPTSGEALTSAFAIASGRALAMSNGVDSIGSAKRGRAAKEARMAAKSFMICLSVLKGSFGKCVSSLELRHFYTHSVARRA